MACGFFRVSHRDLKTRSFFTHVKASEERASTAFLSIAPAPRSAAALTALGRGQRGARARSAARASCTRLLTFSGLIPRREAARHRYTAIEVRQEYTRVV